MNEDEQEQAESLYSSDPFLNMIVDYAESLGIGLSLTLYIGGLIVAGSVTSLDDYLKQLEPIIEGAAQNIWSESSIEPQDIPSGSVHRSTAMTEIFRSFREGVAAYQAKVYTYIHLKNAYIFNGENRIPFSQPVSWRGRLDRIDGFHLGAVSPSEGYEP